MSDSVVEGSGVDVDHNWVEEMVVPSSDIHVENDNQITIAFEGGRRVFDNVSKEKIQSILNLLEGHEVPNDEPTKPSTTNGHAQQLQLLCHRELAEIRRGQREVTKMIKTIMRSMKVGNPSRQCVDRRLERKMQKIKEKEILYKANKYMDLSALDPDLHQPHLGIRCLSCKAQFTSPCPGLQILCKKCRIMGDKQFGHREKITGPEEFWRKVDHMIVDFKQTGKCDSSIDNNNKSMPEITSSDSVFNSDN